MSKTVRFGVSLDLELLDQFDHLIRRLGYANRSEAVRDLIRQKLVQEEWEAPDREAYAVVLLVYDHHVMSLPSRLTELQHQQHTHVIGSFHVHVDRHNCLEIIVLRGKAKALREMADRMISLKGVKYGTLNMGTSGKRLH